MEQGAVMSGVCETVDRHIRRENRSRETAVRIGGVMPAPVSVGEGRRGREGLGPTVETRRDARVGPESSAAQRRRAEEGGTEGGAGGRNSARAFRARLCRGRARGARAVPRLGEVGGHPGGAVLAPRDDVL